jgi:trk system potassium uptake protein TrkA
MERDAKRARFLAERLSHGLVLHEDDLSKEALLSHGVDRTGAFVACAGDDRTNLLAALHAKQLGAGLCLAVVSREEFVPLVDALGIDGAFSLRLTTAEAILRFVRGESVRAMHILLGGSEALELAAEAGSPIDGSSIAAEGLLEACEVGGIVRDGNVVIPREGDGETIRAGDRVLLFRLEGAAREVARAFDR